MRRTPESVVGSVPEVVPVQALYISINNCGTHFPCGFCDADIDLDVGWVVRTNRGKFGTWDVCDDCCQRIYGGPELLSSVYAMNREGGDANCNATRKNVRKANEWNKKLAAIEDRLVKKIASLWRRRRFEEPYEGFFAQFRGLPPDFGHFGH